MSFCSKIVTYNNLINKYSIEPLQSILDAREERARLKKQFALKGLPCIGLNLNIPGFPKSNLVTKTFFDSVVKELRYFLKAYLLDILEYEAIIGCDPAGDFYLIPCLKGDLNLKAIKQVCEEFETSHPLGRFIDVDLNDQQGDTVSSGKLKICFFCHERPAIECRREHLHEPEELRAFMFPKMEDYCRQKREERLIKKLSSLALNAILTEISLTPKPGLVDKFSNGSHSDMDYQAFIISSATISQYFGDLVRAGLTFADHDHTKALPIIRKIGLEMETAMFDATNGANTQKGIIFLMGLCLFSCGKINGQSDKFDIEEFRFVVKNICKDLTFNELSNRHDSIKSHGEAVFKKYNFGGARGEAESGFRTVFEFGLPQIADCDRLNDEALTKSFLAIASNNMDTNILYRSNFEVLSQFQNLCKITLEDFTSENYSNVIDYCKKENISPGGSADLLAVTIFAWSVERLGAWGIEAMKGVPVKRGAE